MIKKRYWSTLAENAKLSLPLYPDNVYDADIIMVLHAIAKAIADRGMAPDTDYLKRIMACDSHALTRYMEDLYYLKYIAPMPGGGWAATKLGFEALNLEYVKPILPTNVNVRTRVIAEARKLAHVLDDPAIVERFDKLYGVNLSKIWDKPSKESKQKKEESA